MSAPSSPSSARGPSRGPPFGSLGSLGSSPSLGSAWHVDVAAELSERTLLVTGAHSALGQLVLERVLRCARPRLVLVTCAPAQVEELQRIVSSSRVLDAACALSFGGDRSALASRVRVLALDLRASPLALSASSSALLAGVELVFHCDVDDTPFLDANSSAHVDDSALVQERLESALALTVGGSVRLASLLARLGCALSALVVVSSAYIAPTHSFRTAAPLEERRLAPPPPLAALVESASAFASGVRASPSLVSALRSYVHVSALACALMEEALHRLAPRLRLPLAFLRAPALLPSLAVPERGWCTPSMAAASPLCALALEVGRSRVQCISASTSTCVHAVPVDELARQLVLVAASTAVDLRFSTPRALPAFSPLPSSAPLTSTRSTPLQSTLPTRTPVLTRPVHVPLLPPSPEPSAVLVAAPSSASVPAARFFNGGVDCLIRWGVFAEALGGYWQRHPPRDSTPSSSSSSPHLLLVPTRAHFQRDYVLRRWLPASLAALRRYDSASMREVHVELLHMRRVAHRMHAFARSEWRLQQSQMRRLELSASSSVHVEEARGDLFWHECAPILHAYYLYVHAHVSHLPFLSPIVVLFACNGLQRHVLGDESVAPLTASTARVLARGAHEVLSEGGAPRGFVGDVRFLLQSSYHTPQTLATAAEQERVFHAVLHSAAVREAMRRAVELRVGSGATAGEASAAVQREVTATLREMAATLSVAQLRVFGFVFRKLWQTLYAAIEVNTDGLERVARLLSAPASAASPVVYLPSHRSYMDFLVLSYVLFARHLPLPHIAAGNDFLGLSLAVHVLRVGGAFFMRRSFANDALYTALLNEYVTQLLAHGCSLEFFPEGTRARFGKTLRPKLGLLRTVLDAFRNRRVRALHLVPVHVNYERLVEAELYPRELLGLPKRKESLAALLDARSVWNERYGRIAIELGAPITLDADTLLHWSSLDAAQYRGAIQQLGERLVHEINELSVWSAIALVSALLLAHRGPAGVSRAVLVDAVQWLRDELLSRQSGRDDWLRGESAQALVSRALSQLTKVATLQARADGERIVVDAEPESILLLASYRNKLLHVFAQDAYALLALRATPAMHVDALPAEVAFLDALLRREVIDRADPLASPNTAATLASLVHVGAVGVSARGVAALCPLDAPTTPLSARLRVSFCLELMWPFIEAYYFAALFVSALDTAPAKVDVNAALPRLHRAVMSLVAQNGLYCSEAASKETLTHALQTLRAHSQPPLIIATRLRAMRKHAGGGGRSLDEDLALIRTLSGPQKL